MFYRFSLLLRGCCLRARKGGKDAPVIVVLLLLIALVSLLLKETEVALAAIGGVLTLLGPQSRRKRKSK
jgi:hypothetical protein